MKKLEIIIRPERLDDLKVILNNNNAHGLMITNIMGYGSQKGHKQVYNGVDFGGNLCLHKPYNHGRSTGKMANRAVLQIAS